ncbi:MAG: orotidine-5'-phosphate decarboxylase [Bacteroidaceae bacterium]|nr:orotidine-5'-phosphate decarboxylase [Bacteroidaceae bacterium]
MTREELFQNIKRKQSFLCVGLDVDLKKIPQHLLSAEDPIFEFNRAIIDATADYCIAYKPNLAFYECYGIKGLQALEKTVNYLRTEYPDQFIIADAKRGDIGNTSKMYASALLENGGYDAATVAPYMGSDSVKPFLGYPGKWAILLALTSNPSAAEFELQSLEKGGYLFEEVLRTSSSWGDADNMMYVVGATQATMLTQIRQIVPDHFLLIPGIGAQGGSLEDVCKYGINSKCGLIVNSSRGIIYAGNGTDYAAAAASAARQVQSQMAGILKEYNI